MALEYKNGFLIESFKITRVYGMNNVKMDFQLNVLK